MADNITLDAGSGGAVISTDDDGTAHHQNVKVEFGADNTQTKVTSTTGLPVKVIEGVTPGTGATDLGKAEDAVHASGDTGVMALSVRQNTAASTSGADGDYQPLITDTNGRLHTLDQNSAAIKTAVELIDNAISGSEMQIDVVAPLPSGTNAIGKLAANSGVDIGDVDVLSCDGIAAEAAALGNGVLVQGDDGTDRKNINVDATTGDIQVDVTNTVTVDGSGVTQPVSGTVTANLSATDNAVLDQIEINTSYGDNTGGGTEANSLRVTIANDSTGVVSVDDNAGSLTVDNAALSVTGGGAEASALRVTLANDSTGVVSVDDNGGSLTVDVGSALPAGSNAIGKLAANSGVDIGDVDITSIAAGSNLIGDIGISGARTSGGTTLYKNIDVDESEDQIKGTAGQIYWIHCMNLKASVLFLKFYNATAANVTVGTTVPDLTFPIPTQGDTNGAGFVLVIPNGIAFDTAITVACTTGVADNDSGAPGANECIVNLGYA